MYCINEGDADAAFLNRHPDPERPILSVFSKSSLGDGLLRRLVSSGRRVDRASMRPGPVMGAPCCLLRSKRGMKARGSHALRTPPQPQADETDEQESGRWSFGPCALAGPGRAASIKSPNQSVTQKRVGQYMSV